VFFDEPSTDSLMQAIADFETRSWDSLVLRHHAEKFSRAVFAGRLTEFLNAVAPISCSSAGSVPNRQTRWRSRVASYLGNLATKSR